MMTSTDTMKANTPAGDEDVTRNLLLAEFEKRTARYHQVVSEVVAGTLTDAARAEASADVVAAARALVTACAERHVIDAWVAVRTALTARGWETETAHLQEELEREGDVATDCDHPSDEPWNRECDLLIQASEWVRQPNLFVVAQDVARRAAAKSGARR
jgi:hypothetical protein